MRKRRRTTTEQRNVERMEKTEERLGEHGTEPESVLIFLPPPQTGVTFRAIEEGTAGRSSASSSSIINLLYMEDKMVAVCAFSSYFPPLCTWGLCERQRSGGRGGEGLEGLKS